MSRIRHRDAKQTKYSYEDYYDDGDYSDDDEFFESSSMSKYLYNRDADNNNNGHDNQDDLHDNASYDDPYDYYGEDDNEEEELANEKINMCLDQLYGRFKNLDLDMAIQLLKENNYNVKVVMSIIEQTPGAEKSSETIKKSQSQIFPPKNNSSSKTKETSNLKKVFNKNEITSNPIQLLTNTKNKSNTQSISDKTSYSIENEVLKAASNSNIKPFNFSTPSPDDVVRAARANGQWTDPNSTSVPEQVQRLTKSATPAYAPAKQSVLSIKIAPNKKSLTRKPSRSTTPPVSVSPVLSTSTPTPTPTPRTPIEDREDKGSQWKSPALLEEITKPCITLIIAGHVDAGKSTVTGHLLYNTGAVEDKVIRKYEKQCKEMGKGTFQYAWVMDQGEEERERGVTMDIGVRYIETPNRYVTLLDAPGHRDFVHNMISGAFQSDVGLLILSAAPDEFEAGFKDGGQTKEHVLLMKGIGVDHLIIGVNKMDIVDWSESRFIYIQTQMNEFLRTWGFKKANIEYIPISGIKGENLTSPSTKMPWYKGHTIIQAIDIVPPPVYDESAPLKVAISDVYKSEAIGPAIAGKIVAGTIDSKGKYILVPGSIKVNVKSVVLNGRRVYSAPAGSTVEIGVDIDTTAITVGSVLCALGSPLKLCHRFTAHIATLPALQVPIFKGTSLLLYSQSMVQSVTITRLLDSYDKNGKSLNKKPKYIGSNKQALVEFKCEKYLCLTPFTECSSLGRIMLRDNGVTYALGKVIDILDDKVTVRRDDDWDDF